jgi:hypothetical protein
MMQANYQTIFEIGPKSFPWVQLLHPIPFAVIGLILIRFSRRRRIIQVFAGVVVSFAFLFFLILAPVLLADYVKHRRAYVNGKSSMVQGAIEDFHPMPMLGAALESFTVNGVQFSYNVLDATPCFHNAPPHKGPVRPGLDVRIYYEDGCIQRVDIKK